MMNLAEDLRGGQELGWLGPGGGGWGGGGEGGLVAGIEALNGFKVCGVSRLTQISKGLMGSAGLQGFFTRV